MSTSQKNETKGTVTAPKHSPARDGKSELPTQLLDFPTPGTGGGGDSGSTGSSAP